LRPVLLYHADFKLHDPTPYDHPENPSRLDSMIEGLRSFGVIEVLEPQEPPLGDPKVYLSVHSPRYFESVMRRGRRGVEWLDPDTYISPGTHRAIERLAGSASIIDSGIRSEGWRAAILLPRPPGHHAGVNGPAMGAPTLGFCIFNTTALIARLLSREGRVSVVDFDLHHGNGTQEIFYSDPRVQHVDIHQDSRTIYPGTGFAWQTGEGEARGTKVNFNAPPGAGDDAYSILLDAALEALKAFDPDYIVVSAGFDGYQGDNYMGSLRLTSGIFHRIGTLLRGLDVPVVVVVEGGYSRGLERGLPAFTSGLLGLPDPVGDAPSKSRREVREAAREAARKALEEAGLL
jgi:acetoin utilization deacetylase AcuC-like enzyme